VLNAERFATAPLEDADLDAITGLLRALRDDGA
jgi:hypothetical protein